MQQAEGVASFSEPLPGILVVADVESDIADGAVMAHSDSSQWLESQARQATTTDSARQAQPIAELKAGTLRTLADTLLGHFARSDSPAEDRNYVKGYLLSHRWFFKTHELIEQITRPIWEKAMCVTAAGNHRIDSTGQEGNSRGGSTSDSIVISIDSPVSDTERPIENGRASLDDMDGEDDVIATATGGDHVDGTAEISLEEAAVQLMCYWRCLSPQHFEDDDDVQHIITRLCDLSPMFSRKFNALAKDDFTQQSIQGSLTSRQGDAAWSAQEDNRRGSVTLHQMSEMQMAEHIACLDYQYFSTVPDSEALFYAKKAKSTPTTTPVLQKAISFFNGCTQYMTSMVLQGHNSVTRAKAFSRFVKVAKALCELRCYNSLMAAVGALKYGSSITRLSQTMALVPQQDVKDLDDLAELLRATGNYVALRKQVASEPDKFTLPVIGIVLKDLVAVDSAMPNKVGEEPDRVFNFAKLLHFGLLLDSMHRWQSIPPDVEVDEELLKVLQLSFQPHYTEKDLYELSLDREPKTSKEGKEPVTLIPFQVWTQSNSVQVDRSTMDVYIEAMVDSVFKRYDVDKSGSISMEEFESIRCNFVFLENFQTLDANQDGVLSREEMLAYFKKVNFMRALRESFVHVFVETTFFSPSYCAHCKGLLWGLVKQGLKCKNCSINCHRHCQDRIVIDCHRFETNTLNKKAPSSAAAATTFLATKRPTLVSRRSTIQLVSDLELGLSTGKVTKEEVTTRIHDLLTENEGLQKKVHELQRRLDQRESQMSLVRQRTIAFVLEHLDNLNASRESSI